jgi:hypothetical protein
MKISEDLSCFIAKCIITDPETWGIMLTSSHGKSNVQKKFIQFLSEHPNPLTNGKSTTIETITNWIKSGMERADAETKRRANGNASGRGEADGAVKVIDTLWFEAVEAWTEHIKSKPSTNRYTTPPEHLRGLVSLKKDDSHPAGRRRLRGKR